MQVNWGLATTYFQVSVGHFFWKCQMHSLIWVTCHLATELQTVKMPRIKPVYMTLHISTEEARAEVAHLRVKIFRSCETLTPVKFDKMSHRLSLLLQLLGYRKARPPPL